MRRLGTTTLVVIGSRHAAGNPSVVNVGNKHVEAGAARYQSPSLVNADSSSTREARRQPSLAVGAGHGVMSSACCQMLIAIACSRHRHGEFLAQPWVSVSWRSPTAVSPAHGVLIVAVGSNGLAADTALARRRRSPDCCRRDRDLCQLLDDEISRDIHDGGLSAVAQTISPSCRAHVVVTYWRPYVGNMRYRRERHRAPHHRRRRRLDCRLVIDGWRAGTSAPILPLPLRRR